MKKLCVLALVALLVGCGGQIRIRSEVQEVQVPLLYCPAPPVISRPDLPIQNMTPEQLANSGELVKHYRATVRALLGYSGELETALGSYDTTNKAYEELRKKFQGEWKEEFKDTGPTE